MCLIGHDQTPITGSLRTLLPLSINRVEKEAADLAILKSLMAQHHYLGLRNTVRENLKHLIRAADGRVLGALLFGSTTWQTKPRDTFIGWSVQARRSGLSRITNNTRFLIPGWVRVPHLASHILSRVSRRIDADWQAKYGHRIHLLETFVDRRRFHGTCYQAANWIRVGQTTQGRTRNGPRGAAPAPIKDMYVYPLNKHFRLEVVGICALQGRSAFEFILRAVHASFHNQPDPRCCQASPNALHDKPCRNLPPEI